MLPRRGAPRPAHLPGAEPRDTVGAGCMGRAGRRSCRPVEEVPMSPSELAGPGAGHHHHRGFPRWPAILAFLAIGAVYLFTSSQLMMGASWLPLALILAGMIPTSWARVRGLHELARRMALGLLVVLTA